jgi:hypothetical protein
LTDSGELGIHAHSENDEQTHFKRLGQEWSGVELGGDSGGSPQHHRQQDPTMAEALVPMANHHAISDEQQIAAAVAAAALPAEHDELLGGQGEEHPAISLGDVWEAPLFAETVTSDGNGPAVVSTENILAWCKPEFKGLNIYFSDKYKPSDEASWSEYPLICGF